MTVERELTSGPGRADADPIHPEPVSGDPVRTGPGPRPKRPDLAEPTRPAVSRATVVAYLIAAGLIVGWFLFGWLVLRQGFVDSVGESAGTAFGLLLLVSIIGTVRRSRQR